RGVVHTLGAAVGAELAGAAVVQRDGVGDQAGRVELGGQTLEAGVEVLRRVRVTGAEQDDRLSDLRTLAPHVHDEVRVLVGAELTAEQVEAVVTARRGGRARGQRRGRAHAAGQGQRRRGGEDLALDGHR